MDWKRVVFGAIGAVGTGVAGVVCLAAWTFSGMGAIEDGRELPGGVRVVQDGYVSAFVVPLPDGKVALVDTGNDSEATALLGALQRSGASPADVTAVLLTHGHPDHTAGCARFPHATTWALRAELPLLNGEVGAKGPLPRWFPPAASGCPNLKGVDDGATVSLGGDVVASVFAVPGHTAGSAAWQVGGVLFLGDSADASSDGRVLGAKWVFSDDTAENHRSLAALAARLGPETTTLAFAHSGVLEASALLGWTQ